MSQRKPSTFVSGLALFSMFFGGGNLVFPLVLGGVAGSKTPVAMLGLFVTAIFFPLIGLFSLMLFEGDWRQFFGRLGVRVGALVFFIIQIVHNPMGAIPRLYTVSYATLERYLPTGSFFLFTLLASLLLFICAWKRSRVIQLLGYVLTPILLLSLGTILILGLVNRPPAPPVETPSLLVFGKGLTTGYFTLDFIASFFFATLVLTDFRRYTDHLEPREGRKVLARQFSKASLIAAILLGLVYIGMGLVAASHIPTLGEVKPENLLNSIAVHLLGEVGGFIASIAVAMACLTTAISLVFIFADYLGKDLFKGRIGKALPLVITLVSSAYLANLGFSGIAALLFPILSILYPALIVVAALNLAYKLYQFRPIKIPFYTVLLLSLFHYFWATR
ncbi:MAG: branched-chain amino acid transport system II carrier protein [Parachlamydiales bacterium]